MKNPKATVSGDNCSIVLELCRQRIISITEEMTKEKYYVYPSEADFQIAMMRHINDIRSVTDAYYELFNSME